jgi:hypothetical protein
MDAASLPEWNRALVSQTLELLEQNERTTADAIGRLRGFLNVNPGGPSVSFRQENDDAHEHNAEGHPVQSEIGAA